MKEIAAYTYQTFFARRPVYLAAIFSALVITVLLGKDFLFVSYATREMFLSNLKIGAVVLAYFMFWVLGVLLFNLRLITHPGWFRVALVVTTTSAAVGGVCFGNAMVGSYRFEDVLIGSAVGAAIASFGAHAIAWIKAGFVKQSG